MIGILGSGQLGRMLAMAAAELGYRTCIYSDTPGCACDVATESIIGHYFDEPDKLKRFANKCSVVTTEFENIPTRTIDLIGKLSGGKVSAFPGKKALEIAQDRWREKEFAEKLNFKVPKYWKIGMYKDLAEPTQYPLILKTARNGYDGKRQQKVVNKEGLLPAWRQLSGVPCIAEEVIDFVCEFSVIAVRNESDETNSYPPFRNRHKNGMLDETIWPVDLTEPYLSKISSNETHQIAQLMAEKLEVVGLLAVEFFLTKEGDILFNELAPRPHNSGHITMDAGHMSQFDQHIRAICGLPLGDMGIRTPGRMVNIIGDASHANHAIKNPRAKIHLYGKEERSNRKLGHINYLRT